jgi:hypothetical protein
MRAHAGSERRYGRRELRSVRDMDSLANTLYTLYLVDIRSPLCRRLRCTVACSHWLFEGLRLRLRAVVRPCASLLPCCEMQGIGVLLRLFRWNTRAGGLHLTCGREETEGAWKALEY